MDLSQEKIKNLYFILALPEPAMNAILEHVIGQAQTQRKSLNKSKTVVKLPLDLSLKIASGEAEIPAPLKNKTVYKHSEILPIMQTAEWTSGDI